VGGTYKVTDDDFTALVEEGRSILLSNLSGSSSSSSSSTSSSRSTCRGSSSFVDSESTASSSLADPSVARFGRDDVWHGVSIPRWKGYGWQGRGKGGNHRETGQERWTCCVINSKVEL
jgi:hypothetical protein